MLLNCHSCEKLWRAKQTERHQRRATRETEYFRQEAGGGTLEDQGHKKSGTLQKVYILRLKWNVTKAKHLESTEISRLNLKFQLHEKKPKSFFFSCLVPRILDHKKETVEWIKCKYKVI